MATYLVTGATGHQGGSVINHLLAAGAKAHAVVRDQSSPKAIALRDRGVVLFEGTHEEPDKVFRAAAAGCTGLFLNPTVFQPGEANAQANAIIQACKDGAGPMLSSIVLSSTSRTGTISADSDHLAAAAAIHPWLGQYYTAKAEVEAAVRESGVGHYTILRPPVLAYDFLLPSSAAPHAFPQLPRRGKLVTSLDDGVTLPYLDEDDVGKFAVAALLKPEEFSGHEIEIAGDNLSPKQVCEILTQVSGVDVGVHKRTTAELDESRNTEFFQVFELLANQHPNAIDVSALEQKYGIRLTTLSGYMEKHKAKLIDSLPPRSAAAL